jgi:hypothetical protein
MRHAGFINSLVSKSEQKINIGGIKNVSEMAHIFRQRHGKSVVCERMYSSRIVHPEVKRVRRWFCRAASDYHLSSKGVGWAGSMTSVT